MCHIKFQAWNSSAHFSGEVNNIEDHGDVEELVQNVDAEYDNVSDISETSEDELPFLIQTLIVQED